MFLCPPFWLVDTLLLEVEVEVEAEINTDAENCAALRCCSRYFCHEASLPPLAFGGWVGGWVPLVRIFFRRASAA